MKLVAAKCPNCGANIDVDKDSDSTKCEFCKSKIIVDDAIAKYKVEISGKVEVSNLPKFDNYMKLGERYFKDKEYGEAYSQYEKACELDPDNSLAVLRKGLSKSYSMGYSNFDLKSAANGFKNAYKILKKEEADKETINSYIIECYSLVYIKQSEIIDYYWKNQLNINGVNLIVLRIRMCIGELQYLKDIVEDNRQLKINILNTIIEGLQFVLSNLFYVDGVTQNGSPNRVYYRLNEKAATKGALDAAIAERNELDPVAKKEYKQEQERIAIKIKINKAIYAIAGGAFILFCLIIGIAGRTNQTMLPFQKEWYSDEMDLVFKVNKRTVINYNDGTSKEYTYHYECPDRDNCNISVYEGENEVYKFQMTTARNSSGETLTSLCLLEGESCRLYFTD